MTNREIAEHLKEIYGTEVSPQCITTVTDGVTEHREEWRNRELDSVYPIVFAWSQSSRIAARPCVRAWSQSSRIAARPCIRAWSQSSRIAARPCVRADCQVITSTVHDFFESSHNYIQGKTDARRVPPREFRDQEARKVA